MSTLLLGTNIVKLDEACWSLKETNGPAPDSKSVRRFQCIRVVRGDKVAEFRRDLGLADSFSAIEFAIPGGVVDTLTGRATICHTVGQLLDIADYLRSGRCESPEAPEADDLSGAFHDHLDRALRQRTALSTVGPQVRVQRG